MSLLPSLCSFNPLFSIHHPIYCLSFSSTPYPYHLPPLSLFHISHPFSLSPFPSPPFSLPLCFLILFIHLVSPYCPSIHSPFLSSPFLIYTSSPNHSLHAFLPLPSYCSHSVFLHPTLYLFSIPPLSSPSLSRLLPSPSHPYHPPPLVSLGY